MNRDRVGFWPVFVIFACAQEVANLLTASISVVDADSFWIDADFEETRLPSHDEGDPAKVGFCRGFRTPAAMI